MTALQERLFALRDEAYRGFNARLVPSRDKSAFIGVRTPQLRALAKQYDAVLPYFTARKLPTRTHNKAIQKAVESYRVSDEHKAQLRALRIKEKQNA